MENLAKLSLLAALTVGQSLAQDMSPHPLFNRNFQPMGDSKPGPEKSYSGTLPAIDAFGLRKRQTWCPGNFYPCPNTTKCCPTGFTCTGDSENVRCSWQISFNCNPGYYKCTDSVGFCCPNGTECIPGTIKCRKPCGPGSTQCFDGCCDPGYSCNGSNGLCMKFTPTSVSVTILVPTISKAPTSSTAPVSPSTTISTTSMAPTPGTTLVSSSTTILTTPKVTTSSTTLVSPSATTPTTHDVTPPDTDPASNPSKTPPTRSTPPSPYPKPKLPKTTEDQNYSNSTESVTTSPTPLTTGLVNGSNILKPGRWLGGFGILFFFVFFHV